MVDILEEENGVSVINAASLVSRQNSIGGWAIKPFAMLMSSFQEFIFLDADALFFQNPEVLFNFKYYRAAGTLYFRGRTIKLDYEYNLMLEYFKKMVKYPSEYAKAQRLWLNLTSYEGGSGVVVMDKKRGGIYVLLLAAMLNMSPFKEDLYNSVHGDKELFWVASEALSVQYMWSHGAGGAIGHPHPFVPNVVCGSLYHVDEDLNPLWLKGGIHLNKNTRKSMNRLTNFAIDRSFINLRW